MHKRFSLWQFIKFNMVGILNTGVDFLVFTLFTELFHWFYVPAKIVSYSCGIVNSYICNSSWTFRQERKRTKKEFALFVVVNLVSLGVSLGVMYVCKNWFHIESDFICNIIATPISMIVNFAGNKLFVFKNEAQQ